MRSDDLAHDRQPNAAAPGTARRSRAATTKRLKDHLTLGNRYSGAFVEHLDASEARFAIHGDAYPLLGRSVLHRVIEQVDQNLAQRAWDHQDTRLTPHLHRDDCPPRR